MTQTQKGLFDCYDKEILRYMATSLIPVSMHGIAIGCSISFATAEKHTQKLVDYGVLLEVATQTRKLPMYQWNMEKHGKVLDEI